MVLPVLRSFLLLIFLLDFVGEVWSTHCAEKIGRGQYIGGRYKDPETVLDDLLRYQRRHRKFPPRIDSDVQRILRHHKNGSLPQNVFDRLSQAGFRFTINQYSKNRRVRHSRQSINSEQPELPEIRLEIMHFPEIHEREKEDWFDLHESPSIVLSSPIIPENKTDLEEQGTIQNIMTLSPVIIPHFFPDLEELSLYKELD